MQDLPRCYRGQRHPCHALCLKPPAMQDLPRYQRRFTDRILGCRGLDRARCGAQIPSSAGGRGCKCSARGLLCDSAGCGGSGHPARGCAHTGWCCRCDRLHFHRRGPGDDSSALCSPQLVIQTADNICVQPHVCKVSHAVHIALHRIHCVSCGNCPASCMIAHAWQSACLASNHSVTY